MKTKLFPILLLAVLLFASCKDKMVNGENLTITETLKNKNGEFKYDCVKNNFSDFVVQYDGDRSKPYVIEYAFKGTLKNNTDNIYKKASMRCVLLFKLKTGRILASNDEMKYGVLSYDNPCSLDNWKPGEERDVKRLSTHRISLEYADYPVTLVMKQVILELTDEINGTMENVVISQTDVTDKWNNAVSKVKANKTDCRFTDIETFISRKH